MKEYVDSRYNFKKSNNTQEFHQYRRMFAIKDGIIYIAEEKSSQSHADWFSKMGWINMDDDSNMDVIIRGFVDGRGIFFYIGYDFRTTPKVEEEFLKYLKELVTELDISKDTYVYAGCVIGEESPFPPCKVLGKVNELIY